jgi:hypothetical protein
MTRLSPQAMMAMGMRSGTPIPMPQGTEQNPLVEAYLANPSNWNVSHPADYRAGPERVGQNPQEMPAQLPNQWDIANYDWLSPEEKAAAAQMWTETQPAATPSQMQQFMQWLSTAAPKLP